MGPGYAGRCSLTVWGLCWQNHKLLQECCPTKSHRCRAELLIKLLMVHSSSLKPSGSSWRSENFSKLARDE